jgi:hypothetical protein
MSNNLDNATANATRSDDWVKQANNRLAVINATLRDIRDNVRGGRIGVVDAADRRKLLREERKELVTRLATSVVAQEKTRKTGKRRGVRFVSRASVQSAASVLSGETGEAITQRIEELDGAISSALANLGTARNGAEAARMLSDVKDMESERHRLTCLVETDDARIGAAETARKRIVRTMYDVLSSYRLSASMDVMSPAKRAKEVGRCGSVDTERVESAMLAFLATLSDIFPNAAKERNDKNAK